MARLAATLLLGALAGGRLGAAPAGGASGPGPPFPTPARGAKGGWEHTRDGTLDLLTAVDDRKAARAPAVPRASGDLRSVRGRGILRALVSYNHTDYFLDGARQRGLTYERLRLFERRLNARRAGRRLPTSVVVIPVPRDEMLSRLAAGYGDIAAGALTITRKRQGQVAFTRPFRSGVREIVVTGPSARGRLETLEDLTGREVWVRPMSACLESLQALNERLRAAGRTPVVIRSASAAVEDEDLLEMANDGLIGITVVDDYLADFWRQVFVRLAPRHDLVLRRGARLAWALRKDEPALRGEVNAFVAGSREGTLTGNVLLSRYLGSARRARGLLDEERRRRFRRTVRLFKKYADRYRFDWLLCVAQGYQESGLDQSRRSPAGAVGVMQVRPETARDPRIAVPSVDEMEPNIHAGLKYLRWIVETYFDDPGIDDRDRLLFAFASYDAGPTRIARLREAAASAGLDPDVWFQNVEVLAERRIGEEPVRYVRNVFKDYVAYRLAVEQAERERKAPPPGSAAG
jgi:membrane-bound lytic murein transglycosylase MltF